MNTKQLLSALNKNRVTAANTAAVVTEALAAMGLAVIKVTPVKSSQSDEAYAAGIKNIRASVIRSICEKVRNHYGSGNADYNPQVGVGSFDVRIGDNLCMTVAALEDYGIAVIEVQQRRYSNEPKVDDIIWK